MPDEMTVWLVVRHAPPLPFLPEHVHGKMVLVVPFVYLGDAKKGAELVKPLREITPSHGEYIGMLPWTAWQSMFDGLVSHGARNYWKSHHLQELNDDCAATVLDFAAKMPTGECEVFLPHMEGAPSRVAEDATAYSHRKTPFIFNIHTRWRDAADDEKCLAWARDFHKAMEPFARGVYVNFITEADAGRVKDAYTPAVYERLVEVKRRYDPENLFSMNQNIKP
jgi:FAD/FMN-containing dehydrogenase